MNTFWNMPGGVVILSGEQVINSFSCDGVSLNIGEADFFELNPATGEVKQYFGKSSSIRKGEFSFNPDQTGCFFFNISSDFKNLALADQYVETAVRNLQVDHANVGIALSEILNNAMQEAEKNSLLHDLEVSVLYLSDFKVLLIGVTDDLGRIDVEKLRLSFLDAEGQVSVADHGRGLAIVSKLMKALGICPSDDGTKQVFFLVPIGA